MCKIDPSPSLKTHDVMLVAISTITLPECLAFGAIAHTIDLKLSLLFYVHPPIHRVRRSSDESLFYIDFIGSNTSVFKGGFTFADIL